MTAELYDTIGRTYGDTRHADPRVAAAILRALGDARTVLNVGAGAGNYEPADREVVALEPSAVMIAQRPPGTARVVQGRAAPGGRWAIITAEGSSAITSRSTGS